MFERMIRFTYNTGNGETFTTVANFGSNVSEADLDLQIASHVNHYGVIAQTEIEPQDLEFEDLAND